MNSLLAARLGMAPKAKATGTGDAGAALMRAHAAHKKGDHAGAKKHALAAVNMLQRMSRPAAPAAPPDPAAPSGAAC